MRRRPRGCTGGRGRSRLPVGLRLMRQPRLRRRGRGVGKSEVEPAPLTYRIVARPRHAAPWALANHRVSRAGCPVASQALPRSCSDIPSVGASLASAVYVRDTKDAPSSREDPPADSCRPRPPLGGPMPRGSVERPDRRGRRRSSADRTQPGRGARRRLPPGRRRWPSRQRGRR